MTETDAHKFVELEIAGRIKNLSPAVRSDWIRAVMKSGVIETAREIIRDLADDPEETWLSTKGFYRRLHDRNREKDRPEGKAEYVYGDGAFEVVAVCPRVDLPDICLRIGYPTASRFSNGVLRGIDWTEDLLMNAMQKPLREIRNTYGGDWILNVWKAKPAFPNLDRDPEARGKAEKIILAGPNTPGRRWLEKQKEPTAQAVASDLPEVKAPVSYAQVAPKDMIERLRALPNGSSTGPIKFDPDNDPELQDEFSLPVS